MPASMGADTARAIVKDMHRRGTITGGERDDALAAIGKGRAAETVAMLRRLVS